MRKFFGKKKEAPPPPTLDETSERLGNRSNRMDQELAALNQRLQKQAAELKGTKSAARKQQIKRQMMPLLRRKKILEQNQGRLENQRFNVDQMAFTQEQIQTNIDTMQTLKSSVQVMQQSMKGMSVEDADDVIFDMEGMAEDANEISEILGGSIGQDIDDADLEAEFADIEAGIENGDISFDDLEETPAKTPQPVAEDEEMPNLNY